MSSASIVRSCEIFVSNLPLGEAAIVDLSIVLGQADGAILQLVYEVALEAGLNHNEACVRGIPILIQNCAIHLADDIADGDCSYFDKPTAQGVTSLYTLQQLVCLSLQHCNLGNQLLSAIFRQLALVGDAQHQEISCQHWDFEKSKQAAEGLNGLQFSAYFSIVSANTPAHQQLSKLGYSYGIINHLANDIMSNDVRYKLLKEEEQSALRAWGLAHTQTIANQQFNSLNTRLPSLLRHLR